MVKTVVNPHRYSSPVPYNSVFKLTLVPQVNTKTSLVLLLMLFVYYHAKLSIINK